MHPDVPSIDALDGRTLEVLWEEGGRIFYRAVQGQAQTDLRAFMFVAPAAEDSTTGGVDRLTHEYGLREYLVAPWAVRPRGLVHQRDRTMLVLDDPGGEPLGRLLGSPMDLPRFLRYAEALAMALRGLHERGLVHNDVNPANVLVNAATSQVWLTGFGIASLLLRERRAPSVPEFIAGTLAYMAPEQTGRMNRSIDSRSDLYALGATLYHMLTGSLLFNALDPMEWVHCHIARIPVPPHELLSNTPRPLSHLIMKLLAKTAEDRYQTAAGVEHDLRQCRAEWELRGLIDDFPLAEHDVGDRLLISEKLYGRSLEVAALVRSFHRVVATGVPELVLVSGYSGVGKTSVVHELHKALVPSEGLFASGKFDQYGRDIPYATLTQALQKLVRQILSKSEAELGYWRTAICQALGSNGRLIVDLIPELDVVVGKQPSVADLSPRDAQRRFQTALRRFIGAFARPNHPLVLFLDDLQWLDAATTDLLQALLTEENSQHLLLIGAYRDNEVNAEHSLVRKLDLIRRAGATVSDIVLAPLSAGDLGKLIADSLHCEPERAYSLVRLVHEKTGGNPFFAIQFIHALAEEALLIFDHKEACWCWDIDRIYAKQYTDNVVDLVIVKLNRFSLEAQAALRRLASIGSSANFALLGQACGISHADLHEGLWEAVRSGLVLRSDDSYSFPHDRIQEAAYSLILEDARPEFHLRIGRLLLAHTLADQRDDLVFEIVGQFNRSLALITSRDEREQLAQLYLVAGKRAKNAAAYSSALTYLATGRALLALDCWTHQYPLAFALESLRAECELLTGDLKNAEERLLALASHAANVVEQAAVACLRVDLYEMLVRADRAVDVGLEYLRQIGLEWPRHPADEDVRHEYEQMWHQLGGRAVEELIDLPLMTDAGTNATIEVLTKLMPPVMRTDGRLLCLIIARMVNLSLEYGNANASCCGYVWLASVLGSYFGNYSAASRFGQLGLDLVDKRRLHAFSARVYLNFATLVSPWTQHVRSGGTFIQRAFDEANRSGDLTYAGYCWNHSVTHSLGSGEPLEDVERKAVEGLGVVLKYGFGLVIDSLIGQLCLIRSLRGLRNVESFDGAEFDEDRFERHLEADPNLALPACWYWIRKLQARFFAKDYSSALQAEVKAHALLWSSPAFFERAEFHFYAALVRGRVAETADASRPDQAAGHLRALSTHHRQLQIWAEHSPENFENRVALVGAELARLQGRDLDAEHLYQQAIRSSGANSLVQNEALAYEAAARFYAARGFEDIAEMYCVKARDAYLRWGADGKVRQLEANYPRLAVKAREVTKAKSSSDEQLDLAAVVKASQALSSEMVHSRLIERLMRIALQNAGADRGLLILPHQNDYRIEVEARTDGERIVLHHVTLVGPAVPESIIRYVLRTQESVVLGDATEPNLFSEDVYFSFRHPLSILCFPLIRQGVLNGLLYVENNLASHVFTPGRVTILEILASQAAISLENTCLYAGLEEREARVRRLFNANIIGIFTWDLEGRVLDANEAFLQTIGYGSDDVVSGRLRWKDLMPAEWEPTNDRIMGELLTTNIARPFEAEYVRSDGRRVPVLVGAALFDGTPTEGVAFVVDLTDRRRAEQLVRESESRCQETQRQLAHANRVATLGQLSASIVHELSQPLCGMLVSAETALRRLKGEQPNMPEIQKALTRVVGDAKRAGEVFRRIRALVTRAPRQQESLDINEIVLEIVGLTQGEAAKSGVSVQTRLEPVLPLLQGDRVQLQQVILNLMMNALEAIGACDTRLREVVVSTVSMDSGNVLTSVKDSGPGIDPSNVERIFDAFYTTKAQGLGMGLSICRSIIERHEGRLWAKSNDVEPGATFSFSIPGGA